jgi:hypothetical protein
LSDLKQAVSLIKAGKKSDARRLLLAILKENADDEKAWLCMVSCAANSRQLNTSVRNVLRINPHNPTALKLAKKYQIAVNVESADVQDYMDTTQVSSPTTMIERDVISEALSDVTEILSRHHFAEEETVIFEPDETVLASKSRAEEEPTAKRSLLWLWIIVISAVAIIILMVVFVALSALDSDEQRVANETATSHVATSNVISSTNEANLVAEYGRATAFFATETLLFATDIALQETLSAPTPTLGPTDTPLPDLQPIDYLQNINVAFQIRGDPIQYENRSVFRPNDNIFVLLEVARNAPPMFIEVHIFQPTDDTFEPVSQTVRVVPDNSGQSAIFTFQAGNGWPVGDYVAQVFVQNTAGLQIGFSVISP